MQELLEILKIGQEIGDIEKFIQALNDRKAKIEQDVLKLQGSPSLPLSLSLSTTHTHTLNKNKLYQAVRKKCRKFLSIK